MSAGSGSKGAEFDDVERARGDLLEACRMLGIYTVNMLVYAREDFRACRPAAVRRARLKLTRHSQGKGKGARKR